MKTNSSLVKYIVLREGKRAFTLQGIFPRGELTRARALAIHVAEIDNSHTLICEVLEEHRKNSELLSRGKL